MVGMKVEKEPITKSDDPVQDRSSRFTQRGDSAMPSEYSGRSRPPPLMTRTQSNYQPNRRKINILGTEKLGIFTKDQVYETRSMLQTWKELQEEELKFLVTHPPRNAFEEMIRWTEQGKMWKYPINNETGKLTRV